MAIEKSVCFVSTQDLEYRLDTGAQISISAPTDVNQLSASDIYVSSPSAIKAIIPQRDFRHFKTLANEPFNQSFPALSKTLDDVIQMKKSAKIGILNGFGLGLGDTLIGLSALKCVLASKGCDWVNFDVFVGPKNYQNISELIELVMPQTGVKLFPITLSALASYDCILDFAGLIRDPEFDRSNMLDFYIKRFGFDPAFIPGKALCSLTSTEKTTNDKPTIYLALDASGPLRSLPEKARTALFEYLSEFRKNYKFATNKSFGNYPEWVVDLGQHCASMKGLIATLDHCAGVVSVDTSIYHFAEALGKPSLTVFTSIEPTLRTKYYTKNTSVVLPNAKTWSFWGKHGLANEQMKTDLKEAWEQIPPSFWASNIGEFLQGVL